MFHRVIAAAALAAVAAAVSPAIAGTIRAQEVSYADLDLNSPSGTAQLQKRVDRAAKQVCYLDVVNDARARKPAMACYKRTLATTAPQIEEAKASPSGKLIVRSQPE